VNNWIETNNAVLTGQVQMTVSFWANTTSAVAMDVLQQACGTDCGDDIRFQLNAAQCNGTGLSFKSPAFFATIPFATNDGSWHHYAMVLGRNDDYSYANFEFFIDGVQLMLEPANCQQNWGGWTYIIPNQPLKIGYTGPPITPGLGNYFLGSY
jgi:hypothetical protein